MVVHLVALLKAINFAEYGTLTVLVNGDEEISSPGSPVSRTTSPPASRSPPTTSSSNPSSATVATAAPTPP